MMLMPGWSHPSLHMPAWTITSISPLANLSRTSSFLRADAWLCTNSQLQPHAKHQQIPALQACHVTIVVEHVAWICKTVHASNVLMLGSEGSTATRFNMTVLVCVYFTATQLVIRTTTTRSRLKVDWCSQDASSHSVHTQSWAIEATLTWVGDHRGQVASSRPPEPRLFEPV